MIKQHSTGSRHVGAKNWYENRSNSTISIEDNQMNNNHCVNVVIKKE